ncbi:DUF6313 family protein [Streptomyces ortus]|uniref:DUF6313 family protein n=1 Tax=Streptomyces ortus TaxID=2867268 RepID=A0ABT3UW02_9ACTN|nr:DUF6313 family protein [Streptomyces ortus]MCX4231734.1 DUF6313 family protein [Streptomyces ortus]
MSEPVMVPPKPTWVERTRDKIRGLSRLNRPRYWLVTRGPAWFAAFCLLYVVGGVSLGWRSAYEVLVGLKAPGDTEVPLYGYALGLLGWLLVPAIIGGAAGYLVTRQIDRRRTVDAEELLAQMRREAGYSVDPPEVRE